MMSNIRRSFDVDIDMKAGTNRGDWGVRCAIYNEETERLQPHPSGVVIEDAPVDPVTELSCLHYTDCDRLGLYKVDLLTNNSYNIFKDQEEMNRYRDMEPDFSLLQVEAICTKLPHIGNHYDMVKELKPSTISELADLLALMRPGKIHLIEDYANPNKKGTVIKNLYRESVNGMYFKKSHAIGYAVMIVTVMNKLKDMVIY